MDSTLLTFLISFSIVVAVCIVGAIIYQVKNEGEIKEPTVSGSDNHVMQTKRYSGKYSVCKKIGEAHAEFWT